MILAASKAIVLALAMLAGWIVVGGPASPFSKVPCHSASFTVDADIQVAAVRLGTDERAAVQIGQRDDGDTPGHDGCPTGGACCDALCHAVLIGTEPTTAAVVMTFTSYAAVSEAPVMSSVALGLDRPPRITNL